MILGKKVQLKLSKGVNEQVMRNYLAVDIGASSGRLILGNVRDGKIEIQEIHRFKNGFSKTDGHDRWDIDKLINEIFIGLEKVKKAGINECVLGIDTWAVDYVLIDKSGKKLADPVSYRYTRTIGAIDKLTSTYPKQYIYEKTGIQFLEFNTLYQLYTEDKELLKLADKILLIPDYIGYVLTGKAVSEVTNSSTTQMLNLREKLFDTDLLNHVHVTEDKFAPLVESGTSLGGIKEEWYEKYDLPKCEVIAVASHDTASAVLGTPGFGDNWAFLSSGTWSLLGMELTVPNTSEVAYKENYTNEWGAYGTYRFLKNIMGLWIVQEIARNFDYTYSFAEMAEQAEKCEPFQQFIDVNDQRFNNPENMVKEIQNYCMETGQKVPETIGELTNCIYSNLALCYAIELEKLRRITDRSVQDLHIVGGGSNVHFLNQLTANLANIHVYAGPSEATAIGNLLVQMISKNEISNIKEARAMTRQSFEMTTYKPQDGNWQEVIADYKQFLHSIKKH